MQNRHLLKIKAIPLAILSSLFISSVVHAIQRVPFPPKYADKQTLCYDPLKEPSVLDIYGEDFVERIQPLLIEAYQKNNVDPRLIYHRMVGESRGNPDAKNRSSGAYGIFQVLGNFYGKKSHQKRIKARYPQNSDHDDRRYIQVEYHVKNYIREAVASIGYGSGCNTFGLPKSSGQKIWDKMNPLQQVTLLGWGSCSEANIQNELYILEGGVASYDTRIMSSLINDNLPICH